MKTTDKRWVQGAISRRYMLRFIGSMAAITALMAIVTLLALLLIRQRIWYATDPLYQFLHFIEQNYVLVFAGCWLAGMIVVLFIQWRSIANSIVALTATIEQMSQSEDADIQLPKDLREIQGMLQQVQAEAMRNRHAAEEAEQRKNDLVVFLAHDLKTPLTSVLGYLSLLRDERDISPELRQRYLNIAAAKASRLEDLINEFFEITRFSLKGLVLEPTRFNLSRMLAQLADEFRPMLEPKNLSYHFAIAPDIMVVADAPKLERVMDNLLRNALSYSTPNSTVTLAAEVRGDMVSLLVRNRGDTIPQHKLDHVFEQFYRVDAARSGDEGGAGLGLAIALEIVQLHGGAIEVRSANEVIEFEVLLPLGAAPRPTSTGMTGTFYAVQQGQSAQP
ncbi:MAG: sensor histidine kinase [Oscillospiraceae bacterium]